MGGCRTDDGGGAAAAFDGGSEVCAVGLCIEAPVALLGVGDVLECGEGGGCGVGGFGFEAFACGVAEGGEVRAAAGEDVEGLEEGDVGFGGDGVDGGVGGDEAGKEVGFLRGELGELVGHEARLDRDWEGASGFWGMTGRLRTGVVDVREFLVLGRAEWGDMGAATRAWCLVHSLGRASRTADGE